MKPATPARAKKTNSRPTLAEAAKILRSLDHPEFMRYGRPRDKESKRASLSPADIPQLLSAMGRLGFMRHGRPEDYNELRTKAKKKR